MENVREARITKNGLEKELENLKLSFRDIDPMCDAYITEENNRRHNSILEQTIASVGVFYKYFDMLTEEERRQLKILMAPYYMVKLVNPQKYNKYGTFRVKGLGDKVQLLAQVRSNGIYVYRPILELTTLEAKKELEYIKDREGKPRKYYDYASVGYLNGLARSIEENRK